MICGSASPRDLEASTTQLWLNVSGSVNALIGAAGFVDCESEFRSFVDLFPDAKTLIALAESSTFGNFLHGIEDAERDRVIGILKRMLRSNWTPQGIRLQRHLTFAIARKPY